MSAVSNLMSGSSQTGGAEQTGRLVESEVSSQVAGTNVPDGPTQTSPVLPQTPTADVGPVLQTPGESTAGTETAVKQNFADAVKRTKQSELSLDLRPHYHQPEAPEFRIILAAIRDALPNDPGLIVQRYRGRLEGTFRIATSTYSDGQSVAVKLPRPNGDTGVEEVVTIPLTPWGRTQASRGPRREGTLVTMVGADFGEARALPGSAFDKALATYGEVVLPTKPQRFQGEVTFNGNRFAVVDCSKSSTSLPDKLPLIHPITGQTIEFTLRYKGKKWFCRSCAQEHSGKCAYLEQFNKVMEERKRVTITTKIYSDSTMKLAQQVGLKADITCISGASAGQLATAAELEKNGDKLTTVIFAAGANDTKVTHPTIADAAQMYQASIDRVFEVAAKHPERKFGFLTTVPPYAANPDEFRQRALFNYLVKLTVESTENVTFIDTTADPSHWDNSDHPTNIGTGAILHKCAKFQEDFFVNDAFITSPAEYRGVGSLWLSGCTGCRSRGAYKDCTLCLKCKERVLKSNKKDDEIKYIEEQVALHFPPVQAAKGWYNEKRADKLDSEQVQKDGLNAGGETDGDGDVNMNNVEGKGEDGKVVEGVEEVDMKDDLKRGVGNDGCENQSKKVKEGGQN